MSSQKPLRISFLVSAGAHNQAVIEDLCTRASACAAGAVITGTAAYIGAPGEVAATPGGRIDVVAVEAAGTGPVERLAASLAAKPGPLGIGGRLLRDNLRSRGVARALARRQDVVAALLGSDVVVSGHVSADRAVWQLRKRTKAALVHGPVAMVHAIRTLARP